MGENKAKIVVLGGGGFIGSNMIKFLKEKGHFVRAVDTSFKRDRLRLYNYADQVVGLDLRSLENVILAVEGMDYVIHLASDMGGVGYFSAHDYIPYMNNMQMDMNVLKACEMKGTKRLYYSSSACIYPTNMQMNEGNAPKLEENDLNYGAEADQMYGWEKLMMTKLCERSQMDARVGIQHTIFGEYQETEGERMKFPTAIATKALQSKKDGKPIEIWGNGKQIRTFTYIEDCVEKIYEVLMADNYYGAVNIGTEEEVTVTQVAKMCCDILDIPHNFKYVDTKPSGVLARGCSNKKWNTYYTYRNKHTTREGFEELIRWITNR